MLFHKLNKILIVLFLCFPFFGFAYNDNFETGYFLGDLNGQNSWSGNNLYDIAVGGSTTTSTKCVYSLQTSDTFSTISKTITATTSGVQCVDMFLDWQTGATKPVAGGLLLYEGANIVSRIACGVSDSSSSCQALYYESGNKWLSATSSPTDSQWFRVCVQYDLSSDKYRFKIKDDAWSKEMYFYNNYKATNINKIEFEARKQDTTGQGVSSFDNLCEAEICLLETTEEEENILNIGLTDFFETLGGEDFIYLLSSLTIIYIIFMSSLNGFYLNKF